MSESRVFSGKEMRLAQFPDRSILSRARAAQFAHPWSVFNVAYRTWEERENGAVLKREGWTLQILPGFVNGVDPLAFGILADGTANGGRRSGNRGKGSELNRVGGANLEFADRSVAPAAGTEARLDRPDWYPLLQGPVIPVNGFTSSLPIPPFFRDLGVSTTTSQDGLEIERGEGGLAESVSLNLTQAALSSALGLESPPPRMLVGQDFWVMKPRASFKPEVTVEGNVILGQLVTYSISFDTTRLANLGDRPRIYQGNYTALEAARIEAKRLENRLSEGGVQDDGEDRQHLFTLWLLEPEKEAPIYSNSVSVKDYDPDGVKKQKGPRELSTWIPYVQYKAAGYWNLQHRESNEPPIDFGRIFTGLGALGAFLGRYTVVPQATLGAMNADANRILNAVFNETSNEGRFWT